MYFLSTAMLCPYHVFFLLQEMIFFDSDMRTAQFSFLFFDIKLSYDYPIQVEREKKRWRERDKIEGEGEWNGDRIVW